MNCANVVRQFLRCVCKCGSWCQQELCKALFGGAIPIVHQHVRADVHQFTGGENRLHATGRIVIICLGRIDHDRTPFRVYDLRRERRHLQRRFQCLAAKREQLFPLSQLRFVFNTLNRPRLGWYRLKSLTTDRLVAIVIEHSDKRRHARPQGRIDRTAKHQHIVTLCNNIQCN